ncbi:MAG TPA: hypothetical protein VE173_01985 [Longimicrobiales bacterium]|nr:hypothetical protein [Longimicrobiales bacterium]
MFTRCLVCQTPFPPNEALEHFPRGKRVAYDPVRGRLWAICKACKRWSLAPIEERWEALEELEKIVKDRARLLSQTDNIALLRAEPLEIVRVGRANLTEESWWRYGRELRERRASYRKISLAGSIAAGAVMVGGWATGAFSLVGMWFIWGNAPQKFTDAARWLRFGGAAWRGHATCANCGWIFRDLRFRQRRGIILLPHDDHDVPVLAFRCPRCGHHREGGLLLQGGDASRTLRRVLAYEHFDGASERRVRSATRLIEEAGTPRDLERIVIRDGKRLGDIQRTGSVALEIAANEASEQRLLELELADLEAHWRQEEELAAIVDGELTPLPVLEQIRRKVTGVS